MKVLHVITSAERRGAEMFASELVACLKGLGVDQRVAVLRRSTDSSVRFEAPTMTLGMSHRASLGPVDLATLRGLRSTVSDFRPDVVQAHGGEALKYCVVRSLRPPTIYRRIGASPPRVATGLKKAGYGWLMRRAVSVIAVSEASSRETVDRFGVHPNRIVTIPNAVDMTRLIPSRGREAMRAELAIPADAFVVLSIGALTWEKDPLAHLEVTRRVMEHEPRVTHVFVGNGPLRGELEAAIERLELGRQVTLLGTRSDIPDVLACGDLLLLASCTEGMPAVVIEAGAMELPVVAYGVAGVPEVLVDGVTGLLAAPDDVAGLSDAVLELLRNGALRTKLGRAAALRCRKDFDIQNVAPRYLSLYERACDVGRMQDMGSVPGQVDAGSEENDDHKAMAGDRER